MLYPQFMKVQSGLMTHTYSWYIAMIHCQCVTKALYTPLSSNVLEPNWSMQLCMQAYAICKCVNSKRWVS